MARTVEGRAPVDSEATGPGEELGHPFADWEVDSLAEFGERLRETLGTLDRSNPFVSTAMVCAALGAAGVFQERWAVGEAAGTRRAMLLASALTETSSGIGLATSLHSEVFLGIVRRGRSEIQEQVAERAVRGEIVGCVASTEPRGGSDLQGVRTRAIRTDGGWRIRGTKAFITSGLTADYAIVTTAVADDNRRRPTLFLVPLDGLDRAGRRAVDTLGVRDSGTAILDLDLELSDDHRLTPVGLGLIPLLRGLRRERLAACAQLLTAGRRSLRFATAFARSRRVGDSRLIDRQALRHLLADRSVELDASEALFRAVVERVERGTANDRDAAAAKLFIARTVNALIDDVVQICGARGYVGEYPVAGWWCDARLARIGGGADEVMREVVAGGLDVADVAMEWWIDELERNFLGDALSDIQADADP